MDGWMDEGVSSKKVFGEVDFPDFLRLLFRCRIFWKERKACPLVVGMQKCIH